MPACRRAAQQRDEFASSHVRPQVERPNLPHCRCEECLVRRADQCPLCEVERTLCGRRATSESVKVCGCRPMKVARRALGPAYANLQGRKPRELWRGGASDAM